MLATLLICVSLIDIPAVISINKFPLRLEGSTGEVRYTSMDLHGTSGIVIAGHTNNDPFYSPNTLAATSLGFPIFEYIDTSTNTFSWSIYLKLDLAKRSVAVKCFSDPTSSMIITAFITLSTPALNIV